MKPFAQGRVMAADCPSRPILQHITSRWGGLVLVALADGAKRFGELRRAIEGISERMLSKTLKELEGDGMLRRQSFETVPPHVEYSLTEFGAQAAEKIAALAVWVEENLPAILARQAQRAEARPATPRQPQPMPGAGGPSRLS